jgi:hypothetical protein
MADSDDGVTPEVVKALLCHTEAVLRHVYWLKHDFSLRPNRPHVASSINYTDIKCRKDDFLRELINTIASWVYSKAKAKTLLDQRLSETDNDYANASAFLTMQAFSKFRPGYPQGQFGELLLFNFIQYFFEAVPLLRKMRITTSVGHERYGSDAVHIKKDGKTTILILGESKCYETDYQFKKAFSTSLESIVNTFNSFDKELNLYTYDDFIEPELQDLAKRYKQGQLNGAHFELVCLVAYNETKSISGENESEIKASIQSIIQERCESLESALFNAIEHKLLNRLNYIIFPVWELDSLLDDFSRAIGIAT